MHREKPIRPCDWCIRVVSRLVSVRLQAFPHDLYCIGGGQLTTRLKGGTVAF